MLLALKALIALIERHGESPKVALAKARFFKHWIGLSEGERASAIKDERILKVVCQEVSDLGCPTSVQGIDKVAEDILA